MELHELKRFAYEQGVAAYDLDRSASEALDALGEAEGVDPEDVTRAEELAAEIEEVADEWRRLNRDIRNWWTGLLGKFDGGPSTTGSLTGPSDDQLRRMARVWEQARAAEERLGEVVADVVPELNEVLEEAGVAGVEVGDSSRPGARD